MTTSPCSKCGTALTADIQYCPHCGTLISSSNVSPSDPTDSSTVPGVPHQNPYSPSNPYGGPPPPPPRRPSPGLTVLLIVLALLLIVGGGLVYFFGVYQPNKMHADATATVVGQITSTAQANATATAQANSTATVQSQRNATATAHTQANATATAQAQANANAAAQAQANARASAIAQGPCPTSSAVAQAIGDNAGRVSSVNGEACAFTLQKVTQRTVHCPTGGYGETSFEYTSVPGNQTLIIRKCNGTETTSFQIYGATVRFVHWEPDGDACTIYTKTPGSVLASGTTCP